MKPIAVCAVLVAALGISRAAAQNYEARGYEAADAEVRRNADKFELVSFEYDANNQAVFRFIDPSQTFFIHDNRRYFGLRFRTPSTLTGDFAWMYLLRNAARPLTTGPMAGSISRRNGKMDAMGNFERGGVLMYPRLRERFPNTQGFAVTHLRKEALLPNEEYVLWFSLDRNDTPAEFAVALALAQGNESARARLPIGPTASQLKGPQRTDADVKSYEGDPW